MIDWFREQGLLEVLGSVVCAVFLFAVAVFLLTLYVSCVAGAFSMALAVFANATFEAILGGIMLSSLGVIFAIGVPVVALVLCEEYFQ